MGFKGLAAAVMTGVVCMSAFPRDGMSSAEKRARAAWQEKADAMQTDGEGCFTIEYPSQEWQRVTCVDTPDKLFPLPPASIGANSSPPPVAGSSIGTNTALQPTLGAAGARQAPGTKLPR